MQPPEPGGNRLGTEQTVDVPGVPVRTGQPGLVADLRQVTAIPADDDVVDGALRLVVALARATVQGADGVSVSLNRRGHLITVAASDQTIRDMDTNQYATGEGPCVDASVEGRWFHVESLLKETRWPAFTPAALRLGINAILSTPLLAQERPVGALNIYSRTTAAFATGEQELASLFATETSTILTAAGAAVTDEALAGRVGNALRSRQVIALAQGMIMQRDGTDEHSAYATLRRLSLEKGRSLRGQAEHIVASVQPAPPSVTDVAKGKGSG